MKKMTRRLRDEAEALGCSLSPEQLALFEDYCDSVLFWNRIAGLTAHRTEREIVDLMFLDSIAVAPCRENLGGRVCDAGTGGGFPGIPIKIMYPETDMTLIDPSTKKCDFLEKLTRRFGMGGCRVLRGRCGEVKETFDSVVTRAFRGFPELIPETAPLIRDGGRLFAWKGPGWKSELANAEGIAEGHGLFLESALDYRLPDSEAVRTIVVLRKG